MAQNCSDCYNGCIDITTDKCIRYTGVGNAVLGIQTGDSLSYVEQALVTFLSSVLDGTGIKLDIDEEIICELVSQYLQECDDLTALELFKALIQAACDLQEQVDAVVADIAVIEADYTVDCLEGVSANSGTHSILQAVITKLCEMDDALTALVLDLDTNYVKLSDLNDLIQAYLDSIEIENKYYTKMIPYSPVPYIGSLTGFDITGAGSGVWEQVYLCNGNNGTPDMRGRVPVGAIVDMGGGALDSAVDPAVDPTFNPNYANGDTVYGVNKIILTENELPEHTHTASVNDPEHTHAVATTNIDTVGVAISANSTIAYYRNITDSNNNYQLSDGGVATPTLGEVETKATGITVTNSTVGSDEAHDNKQPTYATYFIIHIPS